MISLTGKVAVVTGASRGIGKGVAVALGDHGATVYVTGRTAIVGDANCLAPSARQPQRSPAAAVPGSPFRSTTPTTIR